MTIRFRLPRRSRFPANAWVSFGQNIILSLVVKFACLALTAAGYANMWAAIFADVGVMIIAVLNAIRALKYKK